MRLPILCTPVVDPSEKQLATRLVDHIERLDRQCRDIAGRLGQRQPLGPTFAEERRLTAELGRRASDSAAMERERTLLRAIDEVYFAAELRPSAVYYTGSGAVAMNSFAPVMRFPNGAISSASTQAASRELWPKTVCRITVWYTSTVGSTATFNFRFNSIYFGEGGTTTGPVIGVDWTAPGPAVANTILTTSAIQATPHYASPSGVTRFQLFRNAQGEDTNVNGLDILLALVTLEERA